MIMLAILLISALNAGAQDMPDYVYIGTQKEYHVNSVDGSTYTWKIDGLEQSATTNIIDITWNTPGKFSLSVQEHAGCDGPVQTGEVYVYQITPPGDLTECVENIPTAYYNTVTKEIIIEHPDYYIFKPEEAMLDLKPPNFVDFFPSTCPVQIRWKIERIDGSNLIQVIPAFPKPYETGQPSTYGNIQLQGDPGNGDKADPVNYKITYWIVDCNEITSYTNSQTITINPRPQIK